MLAAAAGAGLASVGCAVIDIGVVTTPTVGVMIGQTQARGGLAITASHNPVIWNGLKCLDATGVAPPPADAKEIIRLFQAREFDYAPVEKIAPLDRDRNSAEIHVARVIRALDDGSARGRRYRVVLDSVNGAGCVAGRMLLEELGCEVVHLNGEPTGFFAHTPEPIEGNLRDLSSLVRSSGAHVGFAQDPDADRLAVVDENGRYFGEEYTLVLAARRLLEQRGPAVMAANLSTSRMIDDLAARYPGSRVLRTAVGEANVAAAMQREGATIGGEGNGGVIYPPVCWVRDSLSAMALVLGLMAAHGRPLSALVDEMPRYAMIKRKRDLAAIGGQAAIGEMLARVARGVPGATVNQTDGVRLDFADGWVHLRASNTEPIIRIIAEAPTTTRAEELMEIALPSTPVAGSAR